MALTSQGTKKKVCYYYDGEYFVCLCFWAADAQIDEIRHLGANKGCRLFPLLANLAR